MSEMTWEQIEHLKRSINEPYKNPKVYKIDLKASGMSEDAVNRIIKQATDDLTEISRRDDE